MWRAYLDCTRLLLRALDRQLVRDAGLCSTDFEILVVLSESPARRLRMGELAEVMTATRGGVTRAVSRLVGEGWVRRVECEDDRRGMLAELTDQGAAKLADAAPGHVAAVRQCMFDVLSPHDVSRLAGLYTEMRSHLRENCGETADA